MGFWGTNCLSGMNADSVMKREDSEFLSPEWFWVLLPPKVPERRQENYMKI